MQNRTDAVFCMIYTGIYFGLASPVKTCPIVAATNSDALTVVPCENPYKSLYGTGALWREIDPIKIIQ